MDASVALWCLVAVTAGSMAVTIFDVLVYKQIQRRLKGIELIQLDQRRLIERCQDAAADADEKADKLMGTVWKAGRLFHDVYKD